MLPRRSVSRFFGSTLLCALLWFSFRCSFIGVSCHGCHGCIPSFLRCTCTPPTKDESTNHSCSCSLFTQSPNMNPIKAKQCSPSLVTPVLYSPHVLMQLPQRLRPPENVPATLLPRIIATRQLLSQSQISRAAWPSSFAAQRQTVA